MACKLSEIKRKILIIEDNELNREILTSLLEEEYDVYGAENGEEGIKFLSKHYAELSVIILDVYMPVCDGFEFLRRTQSDPLLASVPVIVATASDSPDDEVKCLKLGASDFITKPYNPDVALGRVRSIIKLKESVCTLSEVEYDDLTGLYTIVAFYHHVQETLNADSQTNYSIALIDYHGFKLINGIYGEKTGDQILKYTADSLKKSLSNVLMARQGDKFYIFFSSVDLPDTSHIESQVREIMSNAPISNLVCKIGIYQNVERGVAISTLCDRVGIATAVIKNQFEKTVSYYDEKIQKRELEERYMETCFDDAIDRHEFVIWYQPKVDTQTEKVVAAEALVRWIHADGKMMPPGVFIPLFERDGLVSRLDEYVFKSVCSFIRDRIQNNLPVVPVSINLSRNSIYQKNTVEKYAQIVDEYAVPKSYVPIELTESASINGNEVLALMEKFNEAGFSLHMDDFGSGYSSLSSLASMPFDVIKLDKSLVDRIGNSKGNTLIRHTIDIGQEMGMKVVAEGVETRPQVEFLKKAGCDMIQGYYFSPPKNQQIFEDILDHLDERITLDLDTEYRRININMNTEFELDEKSMAILEQAAEGMMEGFFIYRATSDETLLYANQETIRIFGCEDLLDFRKHIGNSFRGIVHPNEYNHVEKSIFEQINNNDDDKDAVEYHIIRKDGSVGYVKDRGHCVHTENYGNIFYVFIKEDACKVS